MINDGVPHEVPSYEVYEFQEKQNRYCVCVFVINEGSRLLRQLEKMEPHCRGYADIVVADGGSSDGSTEHEKLKKLGVNTLLVKTGPGKLGSQMRMAFDWALKRGYDGVVTMDGNGKDGVEEVANFVYELKNGWDHIQGSRFKPGGIHLNTPKSRLLGLKLIHAPLMRLASGFKYTDTTNGYRAYSARFLSSDKVALFRNCFEGYELHYYMAIEAAKNKFKVKEIPVTRVYPPKGKIPTKISGFKSHFDIIKKLLLCCIGYYRLKKKMSWKKISVITMLCIALVIAINALLYVGTGLYLQVSDKTLLITTIRPCDKNEKVNVYGIDSNGIKSEENALCFNIGYNKLIATLIKKDKASGCEIQSNDRQAYYANVYLTDLVFFNEIIESSNITKTVKFSEENFTIPAITDSRWQNGIGKKHNGFFLETKEVAEKIGNGDVVIIDDQEEHIVKNIKENGKYIEFDVVEKISIADPQNSQHTVRILIPEQNIFSFKFDKTVKSDFKLLYGLAIITFLEIAVFLAAELCVIFIIMLLQSFFRVDNKSELSCNLYEDKKNKILKYCFISIVVSIIATLTLYPGIIYSDSLSRIKSGIELLSYSSRDHISTPQSIVGIILYAVSIKLFGSIALVSVIQAFMFFISIFLVCDLLCERNKSVIIAFLCICPCILGSSVFHETNINALTFMLLAFWLIMCPYFKNNWFSIAVLFITLTVCMMLLFNFRPNAIAVAPVFLLFITINFFRSILLKRRAVFVTQIVAVFAAIVLSNSLTDKFVENSYSFIQPGFLWKGISVLQEIPDNDYYKNYFDSYSQINNATSNALETNDNRSFYGMISYFPTRFCKKENTPSLIGDLVFLVLAHPHAASKVLWDNFLQLSGIPPLMFTEYNFNRWNNGELLGIPNNSFLRNGFFDRYCSFTQTTLILLAPWILIVSSIILILLHLTTSAGRCFVKKHFIEICFLFSLAVFYNYAYLINAQRFEYRYATPCTITLFILNLILFTALLNTFIRRGYGYLNAIYSLMVFVFLIFQGYFLLSESGQKTLAVSQSKAIIDQDNQLKIFNIKNRLFVVINKDFDPDYSINVTFVPDSLSPIRTVKKSFELSRLNRLFCGFNSKQAIFYYDFENYPVKSFIVELPSQKKTITVNSKPDYVRFKLTYVPKVALLESAQILTTGLTFDQKGIFVITDGTDFAGRYICLNSGREIKILSSKWYQDGKILYLEEAILPNESIVSNSTIRIKDKLEMNATVQ